MKYICVKMKKQILFFDQIMTSYSELKALCASLNLETWGTKSVLQKRLIAYENSFEFSEKSEDITPPPLPPSQKEIQRDILRAQQDFEYDESLQKDIEKQEKLKKHQEESNEESEDEELSLAELRARRIQHFSGMYGAS